MEKRESACVRSRLFLIEKDHRQKRELVILKNIDGKLSEQLHGSKRNIEGSQQDGKEGWNTGKVFCVLHL